MVWVGRTDLSRLFDEEDSDPSEDKEYQSLCQHSSELSFAIRHNPEKFAEDLLSAHIISDRVLSDIRKHKRAKREVGWYPRYPYPDHSSDKAKKLVDVVKNVIQADPGKFESLLKVVSQHSPSVAMKLQKGSGIHTFDNGPFSFSRYRLPSYGHSMYVDDRSHRLSPYSNLFQVLDGQIGTGSFSEIQERNHRLSLDHSNLFQVEDLLVSPDAQIGTGSFGDVWKGTRSGSPCAVKVLHGVNLFFPLHGNIKSEKRENFERECEFLERLEHPNVVQYFQTYIHPRSGKTLLTMELMDENLSNFLERYRKKFDKRLSECIQMKIIRNVAQALKYLHANHIVHRDLSSNNILLLTRIVSCGFICAKISDFGISRLIDNERFDKTLSTIAPGTKGYMPPESWISQSKYNEKFDVFSFGVLVVQTITMLPPNPSDRAIKARSSSTWNRTECINSSDIQIVPEAKRREDHLKQIEGHSLQDLASSCLRDSTTTRPTAGEICRTLQRLFVSCSCHYYKLGRQL